MVVKKKHTLVVVVFRVVLLLRLWLLIGPHFTPLGFLLSWLNDWNVHHLFIFDQKIVANNNGTSLSLFKNKKIIERLITNSRGKKLQQHLETVCCVARLGSNAATYSVNLIHLCDLIKRKQERESSSFFHQRIRGERDLIVVVCLDYLSSPDVLSSLLGVSVLLLSLVVLDFFFHPATYLCVCVLPPVCFRMDGVIKGTLVPFISTRN